MKEIYVDPLIKQYIVDIVDATRQHENVYLGASPARFARALPDGQARALLDGRDFVIPDDVKELALHDPRPPRDREPIGAGKEHHVL